MDQKLRPYEAFWKSKRMTVHAASSLKAQEMAAKAFKAKKQYEVTVVLADVVHHPGSLPGS